MSFTRLQFRRGSSAQWTTANPVLASGELGLETDTNRFKLGNGTTAWTLLPYGGLRGDAGAAGVKGDAGATGAGVPGGGTTGQILSKNSNADYQTSWTALSTAGRTGLYADLLSKPTLFSGAYSDLTGKPTLFDGTWTSLSGKPTFATVATSGSYTDLINVPIVVEQVHSFLFVGT